MNRQFGTKWFTFYTKIRPWIICLTTFTVVADFMQYQKVYTGYWWMMVYFFASLVRPVLCIMVFVKSLGDYGDFVRFVNGVLIFETVGIAYGQAVRQYIQNKFDINITLVVGIITLVLGYFIWYCLNIKYFKKRILVIADDYSPNEENTDQFVNQNGELIVDTDKICFCHKCGEKLIDNSRFCYKCGTKVSESVISGNTIAIEPIIIQGNQLKKKKSKSNIILFAVLGILLTATVVATICIISGLSSDRIVGGKTDNGGNSSFRQYQGDGISKYNANLNKDTMTIAIEANFKPYSWVEDGKCYGLHIDIAKDIAKRTRKSVSFVVVDFHDIISGVSSGQYDMAFGFEKVPEREGIVAFTDEYYDGMCAIYHTNGKEASFSKWLEYTITLRKIKEDGTLDTLLSKYNLS